MRTKNKGNLEMVKLLQSGWVHYVVGSVLSAVTLAMPTMLCAQMVMPGQFGVSPMGAATYSIPLAVPPNVGGVVPKLAINYNSQAKNGLFGVGWGLSGLSAITRCSLNMKQDGIVGRINYDLNDRYCLDGQRLVLVSGTYGGEGAEYRLETDNGSKITSYVLNGVTGGPGYFVLKTKEGLTFEYGKSTAKVGASSTTDMTGSVLMLNGKSAFKFWPIDSVFDSNNNGYDVGYFVSAGSFVPTSIKYKAAMTRADAFVSEIKFRTLLRNDTSPSYTAGFSYQLTYLIDQIQMTYGPGVVQTYAVNYDSRYGFATLPVSIQHCSDSVCELPLTIKYPTNSEVSTQPFNFSQKLLTGVTFGRLLGDVVYNRVGDFNGDGKADLATATGDNIYMKLSTGSGYVSEYWPVANLWGSASYTFASDFNGDGILDIASISGVNAYMKLSTGSGFTSETWPVTDNWGGAQLTRVGDFNGDGISDIASIIGANVYVKISTGKGFISQVWPVENSWGIADYTWIGDFNGDGLSDFASASDGNVFLKLSTGSGFISKTWPVEKILGASGYTWVADFNGDGLTDIASNVGNTFYMKINTGAGFLNQQWYISQFNQYSVPGTPPRTLGSPSETWVADFNGDGKADILSMNAYEISLFTSLGRAFRDDIIFRAQALDGQVSFLGDFDGDGLLDIHSFQNGGNRYLERRFLSQDYKISSFDNGLSSIDLTYKSLSQGLKDSYTLDAKPVFPLVRVVSPLYVVNQAKTNINTTSTILNYKYGNLLAEQGRGLLGFEWTQVEDLVSGKISRNYYRQDFPFISMVSKSTQGYGGINKSFDNMSQTSYEYGCYDFDGTVGCQVGANKRYFPYMSKMVETAKDPSGKALPGKRTETIYDCASAPVKCFGNAAQVKMTTLNPDGTDSLYVKTINNDFVNDEANWMLGKLVRSKATSTTP